MCVPRYVTWAKSAFLLISFHTASAVGCVKWQGYYLFPVLFEDAVLRG
jgi:hypothetical protein